MTMEQTIKTLAGLAYILGGKGSGNRGHAGRPGKRGGSGSGGDKKRSGLIDVSGYPKDAALITKEMQMAQATYSDIDANMNMILNKISKKKIEFAEVEGTLNKQNVDKIVENAKAELSKYNQYLAGDTALLGRDYIDHVHNILSSKELKGLDAKHVDAMIKDSVRKLVYQEVESNRQAFTDHGIRHIVGNIQRQDQIAGAMTTGKVPPMERLMGAMTMINHDVGYTTPLIREGGVRSVMASKNHPAFSEKILAEQADKWDKGKVFSKEQYNTMLDLTRTHDITTINKKDVLGTSTRLSDNLSLFSKEKLPGSFKYISNGKSLLTKLGDAAGNKNTIEFEKVQTKLYKSIDKAQMNTQLKRDLKASVREMSMVTPKFTLGVLAGEVSKVKKESGKAIIEIKHNKWDSFLQTRFDMGQRQTKKLLTDYGHTDFSKTEYDLGGVITLRVTGVKSK